MAIVVRKMRLHKIHKEKSHQKMSLKNKVHLLMLRIIKHLLPLFIVQFFTWLALFSLWIYATPVITKYVFNSTDAESRAFENGTTWVGICFAFYSTLAAVLAFTIPVLTKRYSKYKLHAVALLIGSIGLLLIISNIPYSIISDMAPENKMTTYFAVFNFSIVIPQITAAFLLGFLTRHYFSGQTNLTILIGGAAMLVAAIIMFFVKEKTAE
jgi:maltose/moltooligosaccharide transporter